MKRVLLKSAYVTVIARLLWIFVRCVTLDCMKKEPDERVAPDESDLGRQSTFKCVSTDYRNCYGERMWRYIAPVPREIVSLIDQILKSPKDQRYRETAFCLISHLIYHGKPVEVPHMLIEKFPGAPEHRSRIRKLIKQLDRLIVIVDKRKQFKGPKFDESKAGGKHKSKAYKYGLTDEAIKLVHGGTSFVRHYREASRAAKTPKAVKFDERAFGASPQNNGTTIKLTDEFISVVRRLASHPFYFDRVAALQDPQVLSNDKLRSVAYRYPHGLVFANYQLQRSGRLGTVSHNLQGLPKALRKYLRPPDLNREYMYFDYKSQEPRLLAYLADDDDFMNHLQGDIYTELARDVEITRDMAKRVVCSLIYGSNRYALAKRLGGKSNGEGWKDQLDTANRALGWFEAKCPSTIAWIEAEVERIRQEGKAVTALDGTTRIHFARRKDGQVRVDAAKDESGKKVGGARGAGISHLVQGLGADLLRHLLVELETRLAPHDAQVALPIHDGLLIELPRVRAAHDFVTQIVSTTMTTLPSQRLPHLHLPAEGPITWHEASPQPHLTNTEDEDDDAEDAEGEDGPYI